MKKLMFAAIAAASMSLAYAEDAGAPMFWGFGNYGIYSGYQLYGSLVNREPTAQGYVEGNFNIPSDLGYLGIGVWSNSDLTKRRSGSSLGNLFNEWDFNIHWGTTFWFDDDKTVGLAYRTSVVWYYYPPENYAHGRVTNHTTMDWNHYFELVNPIVIPYINVVHEYHESDGNLLQGGLKKPLQITDDFSLTPIAELVWRDRDYNWCFPTAFDTTPYRANGGIATAKIELDGNYQITKNFGLFAKVAWCSVIDPDLRHNCNTYKERPTGSGWGYYGMRDKDYAWGGVGLTFNF